jgi:EamA domain-containing membrane protein RarD
MIFVTFNQKIAKTKKRLYVSSFILSFILSSISLFLYSISFDKADLTSYSQLSLFDKIAPGIFFSLSVLVFVNSIFFVSYMDKKTLKS